MEINIAIEQFKEKKKNVVAQVKGELLIKHDTGDSYEYVHLLGEDGKEIIVKLNTLQLVLRKLKAQ